LIESREKDMNLIGKYVRYNWRIKFWYLLL